MKRAVPVLAALAALAATVLAGAPAMAQPVPGQPDATRGEDLARRLCAFCHMPDPRAPRLQGTADVPTFAEIARREETTPERVMGKIVAPPHPMPPVQLTMPEIADIVAYIQSLK